MTVLDAVPVGRITERARQANPLAVAVALIAGLLFGLGWLAFKIVRILWFMAVWCVFALAEGWNSARKDARGPA
jgi:F0F1-type ATP synthase assembly protein I